MTSLRLLTARWLTPGFSDQGFAASVRQYTFFKIMLGLRDSTRMEDQISV